MSERPTVLILGAAGGIGSELARRLTQRGVLPVLNGRDADRLAPLAAELGAPTAVGDAADFRVVEDLVRQAKEAGKLVGAVNCVGSMLLKPAHLTTQPEFDETFAKNVATAFGLVRASARSLKGGGSIVLVSSCAALAGLPNHEAIAAAKGAIIGLTQSAAATYAHDGVRVNAVAPGLVRTPLTAKITGNEQALENSRAMHPLGRIGEPSDIAAAIDYLLGSEATWVTGQVLGVDGGLAALRARGR